MPRPTDYCDSISFTVDQLRTLSGDFFSEYKPEKNRTSLLIVSLGREVYDLSQYVNSHPGGASILERCGGLEIDHIFDDGTHKRADIERVLKSKQVEYLGILLDGEAAPYNDSLAAEIKARLGKIYPVSSQLNLFGFFSDLLKACSSKNDSAPLDEATISLKTAPAP